MSRIDVAREAFVTVYLCKLFYDFGRLDMLDTNFPVDEDYRWTLEYEAMNGISGAIWEECDENRFVQKYYFSDPAMMEYYRLCRAYCGRFGVSLKDNPYMNEASAYVHRMLRWIDGNFGYTLQTKINHEWASGIVAGYDEYFYSHTELIEALLYIFDFYKNGVETLKAALSQETGGAAGKTQAKEAA